MAKGDSIRITMATPDSTFETGITVTTAGRKLVRRTTVRAKISWIDIAEANRNGKPTGDVLSVRQDAVLSLLEHREPKA